MTTTPGSGIGGLAVAGTSQPAAAAVLMYHAVTGSGADPTGADPHYAIGIDTFEHHLRALGEAGASPCSVAALLAGSDRRPPGRPSVALTFDDGHRTHAAVAERLARDGASADFFVNPGLVGSPGLLDWGALRAMADAGQSIQSHGWTHAWLDTLTPAQVRESLHRSKASIEDRLGRAVTLFAPPGGKRVPALEALAASLGYVAVCDSRAGLWRRTRPDAAGAAAVRVPRLAVRAATSVDTVAGWIRGAPAAVWRELARERTLAAARRLLGPAVYESARARWLVRRGTSMPQGRDRDGA
jgi:peptidoglycan/xylan/chitin deacetylase (PgdA/CDA1 family)